MPEYTDAPEVEEIAQQVIEQYPELEDCKFANIKYLFKIADRSREYGKCGRATGKWNYLTNYDYVVEIWDGAWINFNDKQKQALVYHELRHVLRIVVEKETGPEIRWRIREHDIETFLDELTYFGAWNTRLRELVSTVVNLEEV